MAADAASSRAGVVSPVAPVHSAQEPGAAMTPGVVNHVNPALQSGSQQQTPNEGEPVYTSVPDPVRNSAGNQQVPHDWTVQKPAPEKLETPPQKPLSQVLMDNLKSMWTASASAVQVEQVSNQLNRPVSTQPTQIPGDLAKQVLTYQPTPIKKNTKI